MAWDGLKRFPAPDMDGKSMIRNGDQNELTGKFWDIGPVTHVVDEKNKTLFNVTEKGHVLGHGFVKRQVVTRDDGIYIRTYKEAYSATINNPITGRRSDWLTRGFSATANSMNRSVWGTVDQRIWVYINYPNYSTANK